MRKLFVPFVALAATALVFTSCKEDTTKPEIKLPTDALIIDLGDEAAALKGVTAEDNKDGDVTKSIKVTGLDFVGAVELKYSAFDAANNEGTANRKVTIKAGGLKGNYRVTDVDLDAGELSTSPYNITVNFLASDPTVLVVSGFPAADDKNNWQAEFTGDGKSMALTMKAIPVKQGTATGTASGSLTYKKGSSGYEVEKWAYRVDWDDPTTDPWRYEATFALTSR